MRKNNIKMQLSSMNKAIIKYADQESKSQELKASDANSIRQNVLYSQPYNNMEVYRSNKIYKTLKLRSQSIKNDINNIKNSEE